MAATFAGRPGEQSTRAAKRMMAPRLLVIDGFYPRPDRDSGSVSITNFMRLALHLGFAVTYVSRWQFAGETPYRDRLAALGVRTVGGAEYPTIEALLKAEGGNFAAVVLSRHDAGGDFYERVRADCPQARVIFNPVDLHHLRLERQASLSGDAEVARRAAGAKERELFLINNADATIVVSDVEKQYLRGRVPSARVIHIPLVRDIPGRVRGFAERADIGFIGNFLHNPNGDGVAAFLTGTWPRIHTALPEARFRIFGADWPDPAPFPLGENVEIVGYVPDLADAFEAVRVMVAPLRFGAGAKGKVVSCLAHGVPCVASPIGAEGMGLTDRVNIMIASDPAAFSERVVALYRDGALWNRISDAGLKFVRKRHSFTHGAGLMRRLMEDIDVLRRPWWRRWLA